ncbi:uncharacterized protein V1516DRAFT_677402 [Lipomyces oligophaga]|uniref:uncharacterized protein n=1 Tax=Lipomyces oligophaga TaxID=45792 RepID=UPI0034CD52D5
MKDHGYPNEPSKSQLSFRPSGQFEGLSKSESQSGGSSNCNTKRFRTRFPDPKKSLLQILNMTISHYTTPLDDLQSVLKDLQSRSFGSTRIDHIERIQSSRDVEGQSKSWSRSLKSKSYQVESHLDRLEDIDLRIYAQTTLNKSILAKALRPIYRERALLVYRQILIEIEYFFDRQTREVIRHIIRRKFRKKRNLIFNSDAAEFQYREAKSFLLLLRRANVCEVKPCLELLRLGWGQSGILKFQVVDQLFAYHRVENCAELAGGSFESLAEWIENIDEESVHQLIEQSDEFNDSHTEVEDLVENANCKLLQFSAKELKEIRCIMTDSRGPILDRNLRLAFTHEPQLELNFIGPVRALMDFSKLKPEPASIRKGASMFAQGLPIAVKRLNKAAKRHQAKIKDQLPVPVPLSWVVDILERLSHHSTADPPMFRFNMAFRLQYASLPLPGHPGTSRGVYYSPYFDSHNQFCLQTKINSSHLVTRVPARMPRAIFIRRCYLKLLAEIPLLAISQTGKWSAHHIPLLVRPPPLVQPWMIQ